MKVFLEKKSKMIEKRGRMLSLFKKWQEKLQHVFSGKRLDTDATNEIRKILFESDLSKVWIERLIVEVEKAAPLNFEDAKKIMAAKTLEWMHAIETNSLDVPRPGAILLIGINGAGKTTTAARLGYYYKQKKIPVVLAAADTFRAGATEQLVAWADKLDIPIVTSSYQSDPTSVVFDGWQNAKSRGAILIADTAGRIHTNMPLMDQLEKMRRVLGKDQSGAPHETFLVLDGTSGQNAIIQSKVFAQAAPISGLIITKLDGTSKGGGPLSAALEFNLPIRFIGVGEKEQDLKPFQLEEFVNQFYDL